jgi:hypothetical protein
MLLEITRRQAPKFPSYQSYTEQSSYDLPYNFNLKSAIYSIPERHRHSVVSVQDRIADAMEKTSMNMNTTPLIF